MCIGVVVVSLLLLAWVIVVVVVSLLLLAWVVVVGVVLGIAASSERERERAKALGV